MPAPPPLAAGAGIDRSGLAAGRALLLVCLALHIGAMFPAYALPHETVWGQSTLLAEYICLETGWAAVALLAASARTGAAAVALGMGLGLVEIGFLTADTASSFLLSSGSSPGHWLAIAGLLSGFSGLLALAGALPPGAAEQGRLALEGAPAWVVSAAAAFLSVAVVAAYFPNWDSGVVPSSSGNAFSAPAGVAAGDFISGLAIGVVVIAMWAWRPGLLAACATLGAAVALASQLVSAYFLVRQGLTPEYLEPGQRLGLSAYWLADVAAGAGLVAMAAWVIAGYITSTRAAAGSGASAQIGPEEGGTGEQGAADEWPGHGQWPNRPHQQS